LSAGALPGRKLRRLDYEVVGKLILYPT